MKSRTIAFYALAAGLLAGQCGCAYLAGGAIGAYLLVSEDEDEPPAPTPPVDYLPTASGTSPSGTYPSVVVVDYTLFDANGDPADVTVEFTADSGLSYFAALERTGGGSTSEGLTNLSASSGGSAHVFEWDAPSDTNLAGYGYNAAVQVRVTPRNLAGSPGTAWSSGSFTVRYNAVPQVSVNMPSGLLKLDIPITYYLQDAESNQASVTVELSTTGSSSGFSDATQASGGDGTSSLSTSPNAPGALHTFMWDSETDLHGVDEQVWIRVTPSDQVTGLAGSAGVVGPFWVANDVMVVVIGTGTGELSRPGAVALDSQGNVYIADTYHSQIKVLNTQSSTITVAGVSINPGDLGVIGGTGVPGYNGDNKPALEAHFNMPYGLAVDPAAGDVYVADSMNHRVRRIDSTTGFVTTITGDGTAGGVANDNCTAWTGRLNSPRGVALDAVAPPNLYIADTGNHVLRCVNRGSAALQVCNTTINPGLIRYFTGAFSTAASTDNILATSARWNSPWGITLNSLKHIFVTDSGNNWIRALNNNSGGAITIGSVGIANNNVRKIAGPDGNTTPGFGGDGGSAVNTAVRMSAPAGIALSSGGHVFFTDSGNNRIRMVNVNQAGGGSIPCGAVSIAEGCIGTVAGDGSQGSTDNVTALSASMNLPLGVCVNSAADLVFVADTSNDLLRCLNSHATNQASVAGLTISAGFLRKIKGAAGVNIPLANPRGLAVRGTMLYVVDSQNGHRILGHNLSTGLISAIAGDGTQGYTDDCPAIQAKFDTPCDVVIDPAGAFLIVSDSVNNRVRIVNISASALSNVYGVPSVPAGEVRTVTSAMASPCGIAIENDATPDLFVADRDQHRIARIAYSDGTVTTVAGVLGTPSYGGDGGSATSAFLNVPEGVCLDSAGNLYIADTGNHAIRAVCMSGSSLTVGSVTINIGNIDRLAGDPPPAPYAGFNGDNMQGRDAFINSPTDLVVGSNGDVYFCDTLNHRIRKIIKLTGIIDTESGTGVVGFNGDGLPPANSDMNSPRGIVLDASGLFYVSDTGNHVVRSFN